MTPNAARTICTFLIFTIGQMGCAHSGHKCRNGINDCAENAQLSAASQAAVRHSLNVQSNNGLAYDRILSASHFDAQMPVQLHPLGQAHLDRLARQYLEMGIVEPMPIGIQRSRNDGGSGLARQPLNSLTQLDAARAQATASYFRDRWPDVPIAIAFQDPHPVGMAADEAIGIWKKRRDSAATLSAQNAFYERDFSKQTQFTTNILARPELPANGGENTPSSPSRQLREATQADPYPSP